jgi:hypothetical protein
MEGTMTLPRIIVAALALGPVFALPGDLARAQQTQTVVDEPKQVPNRSAIPEKMGPPLEARKPSPPEEKAAPANEGRQLPEPRLEMQDPVPNTGGTSTAPPSKPQAQ